MNAKTQREEEVFDAARQLTNATERKAFLDDACAGEPALRASVETLLTVATEAEDFFTATESALNGTVAALQSAPDALDTPTAGSACLPGEEPIGTRIGRYKLLQKIGEGGCGVVYLAEQEEPVRRRVALKIIKLGMETRSVIARFEAERQALAMMDHPNIAHVFDAGATQRGPPYFVMELVRGVKITDYCDQNGLGVRQRLDLFIQICHAIQHAHQKGIVHGDIKPSNILVTLHDNLPVPKVIDFGISKATEVRLSDRVLITADGQLIGTPAYMSPEQTEMGGMDIDTRSDIYSLGVLLYELLTGKTPFDPKALVASGLDAMRHTLWEREPPRPSHRLKMLAPAELTKTAACRHSDPARLVALYGGDLDSIVMKALEKDRRRRYETANGFAVDVQRHLSNEPVVARPPSRLYRFQKLVRRNRGVFTAGAAVAAALVIGMGTSTWLFFKEREARNRAVAAEQQETRLRHEAELRQRITQAALLVSQDRFAEADALLAGVVVSQPTVEGAAVFRSLGEWHALENRWRQAAERFAVLLRVDQLDGWDVSTLDYLRQGPALIESAELNAYEDFREEAIARYTALPVPTGDRIVKICLLLPANERLLAALHTFTEGTATSLANADANGDVFTAAWRSVSLALWEYRRGDYGKSAEWAKRCLSYPEANNGPRTATAHILIAMADQRLGRAPEARAEFLKGRGMIEAGKERHTLGSPVQGFWFDWAFARVLLREATALMELPESDLALPANSGLDPRPR
jgi:tetratricopeptide (TPR) repeat protein